MIAMQHRHEMCDSVDNIRIGGHYICRYNDLDELRDAYCKYCKSAFESNRVVVLLPYYETTRQVEQYLTNVGIDIALHKRTHSLFILDSIGQFFGTGQDLLKFLSILDNGAVQSGKTGVSVIIGNDGLIHFGEKQRVVEFEERLHARTGLKNTTIICTYHEERWQTFSEEDRQAIVSDHDGTL